MAGHGYEQRFGNRLRSSGEPSTYVWDIGANVGLYSQQVLDRGACHIVAFEPAPEAVSKLQHRFGSASADAGRVMMIPAALGAFGIAAPNVVKIDVEGFELEELRGFAGLLSSPELRSVFVEVHFSPCTSAALIALRRKSMRC